MSTGVPEKLGVPQPLRVIVGLVEGVPVPLPVALLLSVAGSEGDTEELLDVSELPLPLLPLEPDPLPPELEPPPVEGVEPSAEVPSSPLIPSAAPSSLPLPSSLSEAETSVL